MPASVAGGFLNLVPLFGIATAYLVLGERLSPAQWAGGILILLAALSLLRLQGVPSRHRPNDEQLDQLALGRRRRQSVRTR
jgi:drug/metabolite transporter (DMT)-like permease